jgi:hypothetical protein
VGDKYGVDPALLPHPLLQPLQRHDHRGRRGRVRPTLVDAGHGQLRRPRSGQSARGRRYVRSGGRAGLLGEGGFYHVPVPDVEAFCGVGTQIDLVFTEIGRVELLARRGRKRIEALHLLSIQAKHIRARFAEVAALGRYRDGLDSGGSHARDAVLVGESVAYLARHLRIEVVGPF